MGSMNKSAVYHFSGNADFLRDDTGNRRFTVMTPQELVRYAKRATAAERGAPRYLGRDEETGAYLCADNFGLFLVARRFTQRDGKQRAEDVELRPCKLLRPTRIRGALMHACLVPPQPVCATFTDEAGFLYQQFLNI